MSTNIRVDAHVQDHCRIEPRPRRPNSTTHSTPARRPLPHELLEHIARLRLILPIINISVLALHRQDAESDTDIATVLTQHACDPLDAEIERIESLLASHLWRHRRQEVRP